MFLCILGVGTTDASFPVKKGNQSETVSSDSTVPNITAEETQTIEASEQEFMDKSEEKIEATQDSGKFTEDDWILLLLWFVLGYFAAHRWYAGRPVGWNILYILTAGGCGIWALVDLINILRRDFMYEKIK